MTYPPEGNTMKLPFSNQLFNIEVFYVELAAGVGIQALGVSSSTHVVELVPQLSVESPLTYSSS